MTVHVQLLPGPSQASLQVNQKAGSFISSVLSASIFYANAIETFMTFFAPIGPFELFSPVREKTSTSRTHTDLPIIVNF